MRDPLPALPAGTFPLVVGVLSYGKCGFAKSSGQLVADLIPSLGFEVPSKERYQVLVTPVGIIDGKPFVMGHMLPET